MLTWNLKLPVRKLTGLLGAWASGVRRPLEDPPAVASPLVPPPKQASGMPLPLPKEASRSTGCSRLALPSAATLCRLLLHAHRPMACIHVSRLLQDAHFSMSTSAH